MDHNKHISFIWKTVTIQKQTSYDKSLKSEMLRLTGIFSAICYEKNIQEYMLYFGIHRYFPLEKVDFQY